MKGVVEVETIEHELRVRRECSGRGGWLRDDGPLWVSKEV